MTHTRSASNKNPSGRKLTGVFDSHKGPKRSVKAPLKSAKRRLTSHLFLAVGILTIGSRLASAARTSHFNERWLDAVISIESIGESTDSLKNVKTTSIGTGFVVRTSSSNVLVTAKHVLFDKDGRMRRNLQYRRCDVNDADSITEQQLLQFSTQTWFVAKDSDAAFRFVGWAAPATGIPIASFLDNDDLNVGAPLLVLGFTGGFSTTASDYPIARRRSVARVAKGKTLIESTAYPGSSGGPVVYVPVLKFGESIDSKLVNEEKVVGVITEYIPYRETAISEQTGKPRIIFEENTGIANMVTSSILLKFFESSTFRNEEEFWLRAAAGEANGRKN